VVFTLLLSHEGIQEDAEVGGRLIRLAAIQEFAEAFMGIFHAGASSLGKD
jgi:hypothetical protein